MNQKVIFPGAFDPFTNGHLNLVQRASVLFSEVIVAVAKDTTGRQPFFSFEERLHMVEASIKTIPHVVVKGFQGLLVDFYSKEQAAAVIRGIRKSTDFEYEFQVTYVNQQLLPGMETIFLTPSKASLFISATMVREIAILKGDISGFVPDAVRLAFEKKLKR